MTRVFDGNTPARFERDALVIAASRVRSWEPAEADRFMAAYAIGRREAGRGNDLYLLFDQLMRADESVRLAGLLEGIASTRTMRGR